MTSVLIKGFPTKEEADMFVDWFSCQGEQQIQEWFNIHNDNNEGKSPWYSHEDIKDVGEIVPMSVRWH